MRRQKMDWVYNKKCSDIKNLDEDAQRTFALECTARDLFSLSLPVPDECGKEMTDKIIVL